MIPFPLGVALPEPTKPQHIAIVAFGGTSAYYLEAAKQHGNRKRFADFVIGINAMGSVLTCDLVFHMDDMRLQEKRAAAEPESHVAGLVEWLKSYRGRVITARPHPDYPSHEEFPLQAVMDEFTSGYINNTSAAAFVWALLQKPIAISLWGFDFVYPHAHKSEKGRGCVEYWIGRAHERGVQIHMHPKTTLMDSFEDDPTKDEAHVYGYDTLRVEIKPDAAGRFIVHKEPLPESEWPTVEQMEKAYEHGKHPLQQGRRGAKSA